MLSPALHFPRMAEDWDWDGVLAAASSASRVLSLPLSALTIATNALVIGVVAGNGRLRATTFRCPLAPLSSTGTGEGCSMVMGHLAVADLLNGLVYFYISFVHFLRLLSREGAGPQTRATCLYYTFPQVSPVALKQFPSQGRRR